MSTSSSNNQSQLQRPPRFFYPAPPPPSRFRYSKSYLSTSTVSSIKGFCCCLFLLLVFLSLLIIVGILVITFIVKPKKPHFDLQEAYVSYLVITTPSDGPVMAETEAYVTLNVSMLFTLENPNRAGMKYGALNFTVFYRDVKLAMTCLRELEEPARSTRLLPVNVAVSRVDILPAYAHQLLRDATINGNIELSVIADFDIRIRLLSIDSQRRLVNVKKIRVLKYYNCSSFSA